MTSSSKHSDLDLTRGVPTSDDDVAALRQVRAGRQLSTESYLRALASLEPPPLEVLRARKRARGGEAFRLDVSGVPRTIR
jgi:hypothetical protein